ncbi:MAG: glucose-6-phosphate isomerase [Phycisphaerales bacterium]|nr:MAG: glucose-6-phosphate isomerase [Phycisphaerales bacterium]
MTSPDAADAVKTAPDLGLRLDRCLASAVGEHGLEDDLLADDGPAARTAAELTRSLESTRGTGWERWRLLAEEPMRSEHLRAVQALAQDYQGLLDNVVVLGIGGSALGNLALQSALNPLTHNLLPDQRRPGPRLFVLDNADPVLVHQTLALLADQDPRFDRTLFVVISKSGETAETAAQFLIVRDRLMQARGPGHADRLVAVTDPKTGTMRRLCDRFGYRTLPVPEGVGGRFSVLSPVGLCTAALCGIDVVGLLDGAAAMERACRNESLADNPAARLATVLVHLGLRRGKTIHVMMPYANGLYLMADWWRQLWAESLGKRVTKPGIGLVGPSDGSSAPVHVGFTPVKALGATDQHSQVQLYREGPNDKAIIFLEVQRFDADVPIPAGLGEPALSYLEGSSLGRLLAAEKRATEFALTESRRPNLTIAFPRVTAHAVGQFVMLWQVATAYAGLMLGVDPYDQPAVELGKQATFALMGKPGYEELAARLR